MQTVNIELTTEDFMKLHDENKELLELKGRVISVVEYINKASYIEKSILLSILGFKNEVEENA